MKQLCSPFFFANKFTEDLAGVKVLHGLDKVIEGGAVVLTLKDQSILADGGINEGKLFVHSCPSPSFFCLLFLPAFLLQYFALADILR